MGKVGRRGDQILAAYGVVAGAIIGKGTVRLAPSLGQISAPALPQFIHDVLETWIRKRPRFNSFAAYVDSEGLGISLTYFDRYRAALEDERGDRPRFDWGASKAFSLDGRGLGECSARPTL